ncbi:MAG: SDR family NAD(P)-dependent oxidoreductase [Bdellovibrionaceae bacterium]|nr:SDR family NAD(P)-dependent oxidoreductase [Pseudobdellovibrionaceae bacterium]
MHLSEFKNSYALITGASSGLGLAFAEALAAQGVHVVLVARGAELLEQMARDLQSRFGVQAIPLAVDLTSTEAALSIRKELASRQIQIRILINNAGSAYWGAFEKQPRADLDKMIQLNVLAMTSLCHTFHDDLASHAPSAVINVCSLAALQPVPYMMAYSATKAFIQNFSLALHWEWRERGIYVQTLMPSAIRTSLNDKIGFPTERIRYINSVEEVVRASIIGLGEKRITVTVSKNAWIQKLFAALFPMDMVLREVAKLFQPPRD